MFPMKRWCFLIAASLCGTAFGEDVRHYTVCDVLANLVKLNGQVLIVKGRLTFGQGVWLEGENCSQPFKIGQRTFDDLIAVERPDSVFVEYELKGKKLYPPDSRGSELIRAAALADRPGVEFSAILEGMIVTRLPLTLLVHPKSPKTPFVPPQLEMERAFSQ